MGAPAVLQGSKDGGLAGGDAINGEKSMRWRDTEALIQQDVMTDGSCSEEMSAKRSGLRLAPGSGGEAFAELVGVSRRPGLRARS